MLSTAALQAVELKAVLQLTDYRLQSRFFGKRWAGKSRKFPGIWL